jgi:glycosyltransferase involved in cell wall biosynthesis
VTFGNVVLEAMASGLAVVAYDHAAAGQLIHHGDNGLIAPLDDTEAFCALARRRAGETAQVRALGVHARATAATLDWDQVLGLVEDEYSAAIGGPVSEQQGVWSPVLPVA